VAQTAGPGISTPAPGAVSRGDAGVVCRRRLVTSSKTDSGKCFVRW
jgi:hypothetical protein